MVLADTAHARRGGHLWAIWPRANAMAKEWAATRESATSDRPPRGRGAWRCQRDPRCRDRRSRCMVMRQGSDGTDDDEIDYHRAWRCADTHIVLVIGPIG
ncbi:hypothetical protein BHM03_00050842 [Ensete ventricosum]|nr:hypothetical protein BHM03_00050842 [Ensete ventricosum]